MKTLVESYYSQPDLYGRIVRFLLNKGVNLDNLTRSDLSSIDEFHVRGAQVSQELAKQARLSNKKILDIGCGIGGPSRMLADEYNCQVTGIDISKDYIETAKKMSAHLKLTGKTNFIKADATDLPFTDNVYDVIWTQHAQMNIQEKHKFYAEIYRVLFKSGSFIYYDIFKAKNGDVRYPMPWAKDASMSFLFSVKDFERTMSALGMQEIRRTDETQTGIFALKKLVKIVESDGSDRIGLKLLIGDDIDIKLKNLLAGLIEGQLLLRSGIYTK